MNGRGGGVSGNASANGCRLSGASTEGWMLSSSGAGVRANDDVVVAAESVIFSSFSARGGIGSATVFAPSSCRLEAALVFSASDRVDIQVARKGCGVRNALRLAGYMDWGFWRRREWYRRDTGVSRR